MQRPWKRTENEPLSVLSFSFTKNSEAPCGDFLGRIFPSRGRSSICFWPLLTLQGAAGKADDGAALNPFQSKFHDILTFSAVIQEEILLRKLSHICAKLCSAFGEVYSATDFFGSTFEWIFYGIYLNNLNKLHTSVPSTLFQQAPHAKVRNSKKLSIIASCGF